MTDLSPPEHLHDAYLKIRAEAENVAGGLMEIPRRVLILQSLYHDSGRNHVFPQMAAHGALWAYNYFEVGGRLGRGIATRYFYNSRERAYRLALLNNFAEGFRQINRTVCIDTYTNYHFVRQFGEQPGAEALIQPDLLDALRRIHAAQRAGRVLSETERRQVFEQSFRHEQEVTVAPGVQATIASFDCRIMKALLTRPIVRFSYFPGWTFLLFRNFADQAERIEKGMRAYTIASRVGWDRVHNALRKYNLLPTEFFANPAVYACDHRQRLLQTSDAGHWRP